MTRIPRFLALLAALLLVLTACGGDDDAEDTVTTAASADAGTSAAEATTTVASETTTAAPETTTTAAEETTTTAATAAPGDAQAQVDAKIAAAEAAAPETWTLTPVDSDAGAADSDEIYGDCAGEGAFDLANLEDATVAISTVNIEGPASGGFFPPPSGSIEARAFESAAVAEEAFAVLETVIGTDEGRDCLVDQFLELIGAGTPEDAEFSIEAESLVVPGADVGTRLIISATAEGITLSFVFDLVAGLNGDCTVYGAFISFDESELDPAARDAIFSAAAGA